MSVFFSCAELDALDFDQPGEVVVRLVDRLQHLDRRALQLPVAVRQVGLQGGARADVRRVDLQRLAVGRHGAGAVFQVLLLHGAAAELQLGDRGHVGRQIDLLGDRRRQVLPATELLIKAIERRQRLQLGRVLLDDRRVELDRLVRLLDLLLV